MPQSIDNTSLKGHGTWSACSRLMNMPIITSTRVMVKRMNTCPPQKRAASTTAAHKDGFVAATPSRAFRGGEGTSFHQIELHSLIRKFCANSFIFIQIVIAQWYKRTADKYADGVPLNQLLVNGSKISAGSGVRKSN